MSVSCISERFITAGIHHEQPASVRKQTTTDGHRGAWHGGKLWKYWAGTCTGSIALARMSVIITSYYSSTYTSHFVNVAGSLNLLSPIIDDLIFYAGLHHSAICPHQSERTWRVKYRASVHDSKSLKCWLGWWANIPIRLCMLVCTKARNGIALNIHTPRFVGGWVAD